MKTVIKLLLVGTLIWSFYQPLKLIAEDVVESPCLYKETNRDCVKRLVDISAKKYKVSARSMMRTLENENNTFQFDRQSELKYKKGNRWGLKGYEQSYGIAMIHLPDNPNITIEEATNPVFAIDFMAKEFSKGHQHRWMGYES